MQIHKLCPSYKDYLWGGEKLKRAYNKATEITPLAESWELSFHADGLTKTEDGRALIDVISHDQLGENCRDFDGFPMLVKLIDASKNLSVQVHPTDQYARDKGLGYGKTEAWYVVEADEGAGIYLGFNRDVSEEELRRAIEQERLTDYLNFYPVKAGECYFIPAGTVHAIGSGCLILEVQQNSNLTYRMYDYGRVGADGKPRELHVDKSLEVASLKQFTLTRAGYEDDWQRFLCASKYFTAVELSVQGKRELFVDEKSFYCITCVCGEAKADGISVSQGESIFIPASYGKVTLEGSARLVATFVSKYYIGIDVGGTAIKGGIVDGQGNIVASCEQQTQCEKGEQAVLNNVITLIDKLLCACNMTRSDVCGVGMGVPGMIDSKGGVVIYSNNLRWRNFPIAELLSKATGLSVKIANDANVATLGEALFGAGKGCQNVVMLTLGTGVGGGLVLNGRLFEGNCSQGAELGHVTIVHGGEPCTCGRRGCLEAYASASALIRQTQSAMLKNPDSLMWQIGGTDKITGKTAFDYYQTDATAKEVVDQYLAYLSSGVVSVANLIRPEIIIIGGGLSAQGERLTAPLQQSVDTQAFGGADGVRVRVQAATLKNKAGILGAAALAQDNQ